MSSLKSTIETPSRSARYSTVSAPASVGGLTEPRPGVAGAGAGSPGRPVVVIVVAGQEVAIGIVQVERQIEAVVHPRDVDRIDLAADRAELEPVLVAPHADAVGLQDVDQDELSAA